MDADWKNFLRNFDWCNFYFPNNDGCRKEAQTVWDLSKFIVILSILEISVQLIFPHIKLSLSIEIEIFQKEIKLLQSKCLRFYLNYKDNSEKIIIYDHITCA